MRPRPRSRRRNAGPRWPARSTRAWRSRTTGPPPPRCCNRPTSKATTSAPLPAPWSQQHPWATPPPANCATGWFGRLDSANTTPNPPTVTPRSAGATRVLDMSSALRTQCTAAAAGRPGHRLRPTTRGLSDTQREVPACRPATLRPTVGQRHGAQTGGLLVQRSSKRRTGPLRLTA
nr:hypothetical protein [Nocardioides sp. JS614]